MRCEVMYNLVDDCTGGMFIGGYRYRTQEIRGVCLMIGLLGR